MGPACGLELVANAERATPSAGEGPGLAAKSGSPRDDCGAVVPAKRAKASESRNP